MAEMLAFLLPPPKHSLTEVLGPHGWVVVTSFVVSAIATPLVRAAAVRLKVVDRPDGFLKPHERPIAYLGGVAVYFGWLAGMLMLLTQQEADIVWMLGVALAGGVALMVGLADDLYQIKPVVKLAGQALAAAILLICGIGRQIVLVVLRPFAIALPEWLVVTLSVIGTGILVVAACNATNLLDGLDGLCSGVSGIISVMFLVLATHLAMYGYSPTHDPVRIFVALAMAGAVCGFLPYNSPPATIFLGDAGSMLLGLLAAAMMLMFGERGIFRWVMGSLMIFGLPILDTSLALVRRVRLGRHIFAGDRSHLYDQLVDRGFTVKQTVAISYGLSVFYGLVGLAIILIRTRYAAVLYVLVGGATLILCHRWGFLRPPVPTPGEDNACEPPDAGSPRSQTPSEPT